jgi:hypothetical protein
MEAELDTVVLSETDELVDSVTLPDVEERETVPEDVDISETE